MSRWLRLVPAIAFGAVSTALRAATWTVTSDADSGDGTLRALIAASADEDTIEIPAGMTVTLASEIAMPARTLTIRGAGEGAAISGGGTARLFSFTSGSDKRYLIENLTLEKAYAATCGAGIYAGGYFYSTIVVNDCTVRNMHVGGYDLLHGVFVHFGGNDKASFFTTNCVYTALTGGAAVFGGGAGWNRNCKRMGMAYCRVVDNGTYEYKRDSRTTLYVSAAGGDTLIDRCVFAGNVSSNSATIGYYSSGANKQDLYGLHFRDCTISNNLNRIGSGMFELSYGRNVFENCVISDNTALHNVILRSDGNGEGQGVELHNCIVERNRTTGKDYTNWSTMGLCYFRQSCHKQFDEVFLVTNTVIRDNYVHEYGIFGSYGGGNYRFVDSLLQNNVAWEGTLFWRAGTTNFLTRCAIIGNRQDPESTISNSSGMFSGGRWVFDSCLIYDNNYPRSRYYNAAAGHYYNCTVVSNVATSGWRLFSFESQSTGKSSKMVDTVVAGNVNSSGGGVNDVTWSSGCEPALTNCYFQRASTPAEGQKVTIGKTPSDLRMEFELKTDRAVTTFLDGTKMPYLEFKRNSPLRNTGVAQPSPELRDVRGRVRDSKPDIGCYEYPSVGFAITGRTVE